jgi:hypothetical protein
LHIGFDAGSGEIVAIEPTGRDVDDAAPVGALPGKPRPKPECSEEFPDPVRSVPQLAGYHFVDSPDHADEHNQVGQ